MQIIISSTNNFSVIQLTHIYIQLKLINLLRLSHKKFLRNQLSNSSY